MFSYHHSVPKPQNFRQVQEYQRILLLKGAVVKFEVYSSLALAIVALGNEGDHGNANQTDTIEGGRPIVKG